MKNLTYPFCLILLSSCASLQNRDKNYSNNDSSESYSPEAIQEHYQSKKEKAHEVAKSEVNSFRDKMVSIYQSKNPYKDLFYECQITEPKKPTGRNLMECVDVIAKSYFNWMDTTYVGSILPRDLRIDMLTNVKKSSDYPMHIIEYAMKHHSERLALLEQLEHEHQRKMYQIVSESQERLRSPSNNTSCTNDFQCGIGNACINQYGGFAGTCAKVVDQFGNQNIMFQQKFEVHKVKECPGGICY